MNIWIRSRRGDLFNTAICSKVENDKGDIQIWEGTKFWIVGAYTEARASEIMKLLQKRIDEIGTNNFNNLPMVFEMPIE